MGSAERLLPHDRRAARQDVADGRPPFERARPRRDPIADGRQHAGDGGVVADAPRQLGPELAGRGPQHVLAAVLRGDPSCNEVVFVELLELGRPSVVPAELLQSCVEQRESPFNGRTGKARTSF